MKENAVSDLMLAPDASLGERVRYYRKLRGYSQECLALECGTSTSRIREIEKGNSNPRADTVNRIAEALEVDPAALLRATDQDILEAQQSEFLKNVNRMIALYQAANTGTRELITLQTGIIASSYEAILKTG